MAKKISAYDIAEKIAALEAQTDIALFGPKIVAIMKGVPREVFTELDEKYGRFGDAFTDKFYMLRQVRNDATRGYGRAMFNGFV